VRGASKAAPQESDIAQVLFLRPEEIDVGRFAFGSLAKLVERYLAGRRGGGTAAVRD
jgi:hypothetical protein